MSNFSPELGAITTKRPSKGAKWRVVLYDNHKHKLDDVVFWIESAAGCDTEFAYEICNVCEDQGRAVCFQGDREDCRRVAADLRLKGLQVEVDDY